MEARDIHLAKYIHQYEALFPTSAILVLKASLAAVNIGCIGRLDAKGVVDPLCALLGEPDRQPDVPQLLVHVFSGGVSCMLYHLYDVYADVMANDGHGTPTATTDAPSVKQRSLPLHSTIFDSVPAVFSYTPTVNAVLMGVPPRSWTRLLVLPAVHLLVLTWWVRIRVLGLPDILAVYAQSHNDLSKVQEATRFYIYSRSNKIVPARDVESHAAEAEAKGFRVLRQVFSGSEHVAHARKDPDLYWAAVRNVWVNA